MLIPFILVKLSNIFFWLQKKRIFEKKRINNNSTNFWNKFYVLLENGTKTINAFEWRLSDVYKWTTKWVKEYVCVWERAIFSYFYDSRNVVY